MEKQKTSKNIKNLCLLALFVALIVLLGFTPLGLIPLGFITVTILCVPVIIGTLFLGLKSGLVLGASFGAVSFISALIKPSALVSTLMGVSPVLVFVMSVLPRMCVPAVAWGVHQWITRRSANPNAAYLTAAVCGGLLNALAYLLLPGWLQNAGMSAQGASTLGIVLGLFIGVGAGYAMFRLLSMKGKAVAVAAVCGSMTNTILYLGLMLLFYVLCGIDSTKVLTLIGGTALLAGSMEAVVAAVLCTPILSALRRVK